MDHDDIPMFDESAETMPEEQRAVLQSGRLRALVDRLLAVGGLQAGRLKEAGVTRRRRPDA